MSLKISTFDGLRGAEEAYFKQQIQGVGEMEGVGYEMRVCRVGPEGESIMEVARTGDLFVIVSRRRGRVRQVLLGSVTAAVMRQLPVPVVLVPAIPGGRASALNERRARTRAGYAG